MVNRYRVVLSVCLLANQLVVASFDIHQEVKNQGWEALDLLADLSKSKRISVINQQNQFGETLLFKAAGKGLVEIVQFLIAHGADVNLANQSGLTPLGNAASVGYAHVVRILLASGASVESITRQRATPLHHAAASGSSDTVAQLIKAGAPVNAIDSAGCTPLFYAAMEEGNQESLRLLLRHNAHVNIRDLQGETALHYAAIRGHYEAVSCLLQHKADSNIKDNFGALPLHKAIDSSDIETISVLAAEPVSKADLKQETLLHRAARRCHIEVVQFFIKNGWPAHALDEDGNSALHEAASFNNESVVRYLVNICGLDVDQLNKGGWTPLLLAVKARSLEVASFLLNVAGAADTENDDKDTALSLAAYNEDWHMMDELIKFGTSIDDVALEELEEQEKYELYFYKEKITKHWQKLQKFLSAFRLPSALAQLIGEFVRVSPAQVQSRLSRSSDRVDNAQSGDMFEPDPNQDTISRPDHHKE